MASSAVDRLREIVAKALVPPPVLSYSAWASKYFRLSGNSASRGKFRPWKFQRGILDAMGDPLIERVTVIKAARTGYTVSLVATIGAMAANDPCPIILLMPTDDDTRGIAVDEIDPAFRDTPALRGLMRVGRLDGRNTLTQRAMVGGGSLKILSARSPRNLRRHTARILLCDEVDGMEITKEGDPVVLAEKRTTSYPDRKIVIGSTPTDEATSIVAGKYEESDQRVFEVPCPHCDERFEIQWEHISWPPGEPEKAVCNCPVCGTEIEERFKPQMVDAGEWRATRPEVKGHAGFRLSALISLFANASWGKLAAEFEIAKKAGPSAMQVFYNTALGRVWSTSINYVDETQLAARVEDFGLCWDNDRSQWREDIPAEVAYITAGCDVQLDRIEITFVGWSETHRYFLGHHVVWGATNLISTWDELDAVLSTVWKHPLGGEIGVEAAAIDAGDGNRTEYVYDFTSNKLDRKIVAIKGVPGARRVLEVSKSKHRRLKGATFFRVGVDQVKTDILATTPLDRTHGQSFRFSNSLDNNWFVQFTSERRTVRYAKNTRRPIVEFVRISGRQAEALDCAVYGIAIKNLCRFDFDQRRKELAGRPAERPSAIKSVSSRLHG